MSKILEIYTSNFHYSGKDRLDVTVKSGNKVFAPTWQMVLGIKNGTLSEKEYTKQYTELMKRSMFVNVEEWEKLFDQPRVTLVCYCKKGDFCHRVLLAKLMEKYMDNVKYIGEV